MDPDSHETPGLGLPPPSASQGVPGSDGRYQQGSVAAAPAAPSDADANDLDEEWVNKAKAIVDQTKSDPFLASRELSKVKADYLRARYNKDLKVSEDNV